MAKNPKLTEFLIVDEFLRNFQGVLALTSAFELGIIDHLINKNKTSKEISKDLNLTEMGTEILINLLMKEKILIKVKEKLQFTKKFNEALKYRDLLESKTKYLRFSHQYLLRNFSKKIKQEYPRINTDLGFWNFTTKRKYSSKELMQVKRWNTFMKALTKYHAPIITANHDFNKYRKILEIGGGNGELALSIYNNTKNTKITIFDIPIVCDLNHNRVKNSRINFIKGDMFSHPFPKEYDCILFKTLLHDWPDDRVKYLINKTFNNLDKSKKIIIIEERVNLNNKTLFRENIYYVPLFGIYREPKEYINFLETAGFKKIILKEMKELNYFLISAEKP